MSTLAELQETLRDLEERAAEVRREIATRYDKDELLKIGWNESLELSVRAWNVLRGVASPNAPKIGTTLGDLIQFTPRQLLRRKNCGKVTISEIQAELRKFGLELAKHESDPVRNAA